MCIQLFYYCPIWTPPHPSFSLEFLVLPNIAPEISRKSRRFNLVLKRYRWPPKIAQTIYLYKRHTHRANQTISKRYVDHYQGTAALDSALITVRVPGIPHPALALWSQVVQWKSPHGMGSSLIQIRVASFPLSNRNQGFSCSCRGASSLPFRSEITTT